jgi:hypothetical protein
MEKIMDNIEENEIVILKFLLWALLKIIYSFPIVL